MTSRGTIFLLASCFAFPFAFAEAQGRSEPPQFGTAVASSEYFALSEPTQSPDGRWIAIQGWNTGWSSIFAAASSGGALRELTPRSDAASNPAWFPNSDRLAYVSDRLQGVVVADFNKETGILGPPRRVSVERVSFFDVSPDGEWIAYTSPAGAEQGQIKLVPSSGGKARVLFREPTSQVGPLRFSADGREIYFTAMRKGLNNPREVLRVHVSGGVAVKVVNGPHTSPAWNVAAEPRLERIVHVSRGGIAITTLMGDTLALLGKAPGGLLATNIGFSPDRMSLYLVLSDTRSVIRAASLSGGPHRSLSDSSRYWWPIAWSADSRRVFYVGERDGHLYSTAIDGSDPRVTRFDPIDKPSDIERLSINSVSTEGRYWFVVPRFVDDQSTRRAYVYDSQTRTLRHVTDSLGVFTGTGHSGPGGNYLNYRPQTNEFAYVNQTGSAAGQVNELRMASLSGSSRVLRRVASIDPSRRGFAIHGDRTAWIERTADSSTVYLETPRSSGPVRVWSTAGKLNEVLWSHDGTRLAVPYSAVPIAGRQRTEVAILALDSAGRGRVAGKSPQFGSYWDLYWTADDRALIALEYPGAGVDTRLIRLPLTESGQVAYILKQGEATFWDHYPSPDGRFTVMPVEIAAGSTIWKIDLRQAEAAYRQSRPARK